ncbi:hypothetical protein PVAP13_5KG037650 [Panicum virgatum]|uniref:Uncharacterized protein n=1 Tax=Panicum virgatum TaxID=38727 RepID=A0A8T0SCS4_PANVG|nr:hypothetical protein PVAP13_5KG037650 [Panicum virgatum]
MAQYQKHPSICGPLPLQSPALTHHPSIVFPLPARRRHRPTDAVFLLPPRPFRPDRIEGSVTPSIGGPSPPDGHSSAPPSPKRSTPTTSEEFVLSTRSSSCCPLLD